MVCECAMLKTERYAPNSKDNTDIEVFPCMLLTHSELVID